MSSISSVSSTSGLANLMQMLASAAPPAVSSLLTSKNVQAALAKAAPIDIVQLSDEATQLQMANGLFSDSNTQPLTMADLFAPPATYTADTLTQTQSANLAQQTVLAAVYTPSGNTASWDSSSATGSLVNLFA